MARRVNPIMLLGLIIALVLSFGILATAQLGGGSASDAIGVGEAQVGKPFVMSTDGPNTFSCVGLMRYILRTIGVDSDAPWVPEAYLSKYAAVDLANLQPGDIVIYPGWATMYVGGGQLLNANEALGSVTHTSMTDAGTPLGAVRPPYGGGGSPLPTDPVPTGQTLDPVLGGNATLDPVLGGGATPTDPALGGSDVAPVDPLLDQTVDPLLDQTVDPLLDQTVDPLLDPAVDPLLDQTVDPLLDQTADPLLDPALDGGVPDPMLNGYMEPTMPM